MTSNLNQIPHQTGLLAWFTRNSVAANLLMLLLIVGGLFSYKTINKKIFPDFESNMITVSVVHRGAAPAEVEESVVVKIEEAVEDVEGIKRMDSFAREGLGSVSIEVANGYDLNEVMDEVKQKVDAISTFPKETERPFIAKQKFKRQVLWLSLYGDMDRRSRQTLAKEIRDELMSDPQIHSVQITGNRDYEISIEISEDSLRKYHLTINEVANAIRSSSLDLPAGSIKTYGGDILVKTKGQSYTGYDYSQIILRTNNDGSSLKLNEVAHVVDGFAEVENFSRFNGEPASGIRVDSTGDQNDLEIAAAVKKYLEKKQASLPPGAKLTIWGDTSYYLEARLDMMFNNMMMGAVLVFFILALFLRIRLAFWVMMGIPVSFLGTFMFMPLLGEYSVTVNLLSLFAFILVLGIVVDDAIVIGESVYTTIKKEGHSTENVIIGANKVSLPATFGVLTTIAAFAPILLVDTGPVAFFRSIAVVVSLALIFSLIESKWILPTHLAHMKYLPYDPKTASTLDRVQHNIRESLEVFINKIYQPLLDKALRNKYTTLAIFISSMILTIGMIGGGLVKREIFPNVPSDFIQARLEMNVGSSITARNEAIAKIEQAALTIDTEQKSIDAQGRGFIQQILAFDRGETAGGLVLELSKSEQRSIGAFDIEKKWREKVGQIAGAKELQFFSSTNAGGGAKLQFKLTGSNYEQLELAAEKLQNKLTTYDGVFDVRNSFSAGNQEISLKLKPQARTLGLTQSDLARQVRQAFYGEEAQKIQRGRDEVRVMVRYPVEERHSLADLENMKITTANGYEIPFSEVAEVTMGTSYSTITRVNRKRAITISGDIDPEKTQSQQVITEISNDYIPKLLSQYQGVSYELEGSSKDSQELMSAFIKAGILSLFLIYALIAIPMKSYLQPLIIMSVIPFGIIGAILGHYIFGKTINMMSMFGIIALGGVVVNDSLIMVDFVNRARSAGVRLHDAVVEAGTQRFRAIMLTSLTTFFGLFPIYFEHSLQAQFVIPMAISLGVGIMFATVITLFLIPVLYVLLEDLKGLFSSKEGKVSVEHSRPQSSIIEEN